MWDCKYPHCGSWLASDSGLSVSIIAEADDAIAGKPAPTGNISVLNTGLQPQIVLLATHWP